MHFTIVRYNVAVLKAIEFDKEHYKFSAFFNKLQSHVVFKK